MGSWILWIGSRIQCIWKSSLLCLLLLCFPMQCLLPILSLSKQILTSLQGYASQTNIYLVSLLQNAGVKCLKRWNKEVPARKDFSSGRQPPFWILISFVQSLSGLSNLKWSRVLTKYPSERSWYIHRSTVMLVATMALISGMSHASLDIYVRSWSSVTIVNKHI